MSDSLTPVDREPFKRRTFLYIKDIFFGVLFCATLAFLAELTGYFSFLGDYGFGPHTVAIILGIIITNVPFFKRPVEKGKPGIDFSKDWVLKASVVLYGFRLAISQLIEIGIVGLLVDALVLTSTFLLTWFIGIHVMKIEEKLTILIGAGSSICGAAAVLATAPLIKSDSDKVTVAVGTVVIFGTVAIFLFPPLFQMGYMGFNEVDFGIFSGATIHSVTTVAAATAPISPELAAVALTTKLLKVTMLAPFLLVLGFFLNRRDLETKGKSKISVPWFAVLFLVIVCVNSFNFLNAETLKVIRFFDSFFLMTALVALGLTTRLKTIRETGVRPMILGAVIFAWLVLGGGMIEYLVLKLVS